MTSKLASYFSCFKPPSEQSYSVRLSDAATQIDSIQLTNNTSHRFRVVKEGDKIHLQVSWLLKWKPILYPTGDLRYITYLKEVNESSFKSPTKVVFNDEETISVEECESPHENMIRIAQGTQTLFLNKNSIRFPKSPCTISGSFLRPIDTSEALKKASTYLESHKTDFIPHYLMYNEFGIAIVGMKTGQNRYPSILFATPDSNEPTMHKCTNFLDGIKDGGSFHFLADSGLVNASARPRLLDKRLHIDYYLNGQPATFHRYERN